MTSFVTLLKRDLRLQMPLMIGYTGIALLIVLTFIGLSFRYGEMLYIGILTFFLIQNVVIAFLLPIFSVWREWRMKTAAHWLMLPGSVHTKLWSKLISILLCIIYTFLISSILWMASGLISYTIIHEGTYHILSQFPPSLYLFAIIMIIYASIAGSIPVLLIVFMIKGERGWKGWIFAGLIAFVYIIFIPWFSAFDPPAFLEQGPVYLESLEHITFSEGDFSMFLGPEEAEPFLYVSGQIFEIIFYVITYWLCWWYLARKVEI
ncbi:hypothetical protein [Alkalicoccobacillus porphyridii]|uniref:Uncharacterized protein n=1 Tax=Alkalicoccobacillus porphyridii TaxID=2597270 RepID=A0A554A4H1_9BACI|nr:hypothetical protein [Alkalicoccobacillus porphyridii]TSB48594.1 hypothetical protein FN960_03315 [Alkalicoccobacillus porphyridii]